MLCPRSCLPAVLLAAVLGCGSEPAAPPPAGPQPAVPGVGRQGRDYERGPVSTPIKAMFTTKQRLQLLPIAQAMNVYKAMNGHFPKTHDDFMEKIIRDNGIQLPELPEGYQYVYDPEKAASMSNYDLDDPPLRAEPAPQ